MTLFVGQTKLSFRESPQFRIALYH